jgi:hypothetical protein
MTTRGRRLNPVAAVVAVSVKDVCTHAYVLLGYKGAQTDCYYIYVYQLLLPCGLPPLLRYYIL